MHPQARLIPATHREPSLPEYMIEQIDDEWAEKEEIENLCLCDDGLQLVSELTGIFFARADHN